jgi:hypothetical protein
MVQNQTPPVREGGERSTNAGQILRSHRKIEPTNAWAIVGVVGYLLIATHSNAQSVSQRSTTDPTYFRVQEPDPVNSFTIELTDPAKIAAARAIVAGQETNRIHVQGALVKAAADYDRPWHFHLDPDSIVFFQIGPQICNRSATWIETHLAQAPPTWCPWGSRVVAEIPPPPNR